VREKYRQVVVVCGMFLALVCCASFVDIVSAAPQGSGGSGYHVVRKLPLGGEGRWDYLTVDPAARRIYISRSTHVMVVDEDSGKIVGDIPDTKGVHGIALATDAGKGYTSNGEAGSVTVFDIKTLKPISTIKITGKILTPSFTTPRRSASSPSTVGVPTRLRSTRLRKRLWARSRLAASPKHPCWMAKAVFL
jgi:hypothetical protein